MTTSNGLVLDIDFAEKSGTVAGDASRYGNDGALTGCKWVEHGLEFNGSSDYVNCGNDSSLDISGNITVGALVTDYGQTAGSAHIIAKRTSTQGYYMFMNTVASPKVGFIVKIGNVSKMVLSTTELVPFTQYHIAGSYDGTNVILYIDGNEETTTPATGNIDKCTANLNVGQNPSNVLRFKGGIDQVRVHNRALNASEIKAYYDQTKHIHR